MTNAPTAPLISRLCVLTVFVLLLASCSIKVPVLDTDWPEDPEVPERGWFAARYVSDTGNQQHQRPTEYLRWVVRFYFGWINHSTGWVDVTRRVTDSAAAGPESELARRMMLLGRRIAAEWAKESPEKRINNHAIAVWNKALLIAADEGEIDATVLNVARDVDGIFSGKIATAEINMARYFPDHDEPPSFDR